MIYNEFNKIIFSVYRKTVHDSICWHNFTLHSPPPQTTTVAVLLCSHCDLLFHCLDFAFKVFAKRHQNGIDMILRLMI